MGLDMYAYVASAPKADYKTHTEVAYWRKHNRLHGWMEQLWRTKKEEAQRIKAEMDDGDKFIDALDKVEEEYDGDFNGVELELDEFDLDSLEHDIENRLLPETTGFFFGGDSYDEEYESECGYKSYDLEFIRNARESLKSGLRVFYNSSW